MVDEFCKNLDKTTKNFILGKPSRRPATMYNSEVISILLLFQVSGFKCFEHYYIFYVWKHMLDDFPKTVSHNRFVELGQGVIMPLTILYFLRPVVQVLVRVFLLLIQLRSGFAGINGSRQARYLKGTAEVGKSTMGWFYCFKLHLLINDRREILNFLISHGNMDDREPLKREGFLKKIFGKLFGDKGYICKKLF